MQAKITEENINLENQKRKMEKPQQKTLDARRDAYKDGMDNFTMLRYTAAMESLSKTILATLQENDLNGMLTPDAASQSAAILAAADMLGSKITALDKTIQNFSIIMGRNISK
ncbi:MAG: hypothetical protein CMM02_08520 [Rhodopirellula sp.]|nr:hypothetical protein [Rhodopirellula sp.]